MVQSVRSNGADFQWVGGDAFYGDDPEFLRQLNQSGETFMLDIPSAAKLQTKFIEKSLLKKQTFIR